jgi:hypothetical protein
MFVEAEEITDTRDSDRTALRHEGALLHQNRLVIKKYLIEFRPFKTCDFDWGLLDN